MRFFCFLLGSALLHAAFLTLPLSTSTGDPGRNALQPLRVRLLDHGSPMRAAANVERPRQTALDARGSAGGAARAEAPQRESATGEAARGQVARERPLPRSRAMPGVRSPAAPEALGGSRTNGKAVRTAREQAGSAPKPLTRSVPKTASVRARSGAPPAALAVPSAAPMRAARMEGQIDVHAPHVLPSPVQAAHWRSIAPAPARKRPEEPGQDRGPTGDIEGSPGEAPGRGRETLARPGGETALAGLAPDRGRRQGPRASAGRGGAVARTPVRYARVVKPKYPRKARTAGWEGTTVLKVRVDRGGRPGLVAVDRTSGFETLDRAAVRAMRRWEFHPARNGDRTVASWVKVPVSFQIEEDQP